MNVVLSIEASILNHFASKRVQVGVKRCTRSKYRTNVQLMTVGTFRQHESICLFNAHRYCIHYSIVLTVDKKRQGHFIISTGADDELNVSSETGLNISNLLQFAFLLCP